MPRPNRALPTVGAPLPAHAGPIAELAHTNQTDHDLQPVGRLPPAEPARAIAGEIRSASDQTFRTVILPRQSVLTGSPLTAKTTTNGRRAAPIALDEVFGRHSPGLNARF